jgi:hypothetical protein
MASDVREYLRAAQSAEIRGDTARAVELLKTAADAYQKAGNEARALQMLRQVERLERKPERSASSARPPQPLGAFPALASVADGDATHREPTKSRRHASDPEFAERGPVLADAAAPAWCSFCCRPREEVGAVVAGPAGAFICGLCLRRSMQLLGAAPRSNAESKPRLSSLSAAQMKAVGELTAALQDGARVALLIGPGGCGKSTCLQLLEAQGLGKRSDAFETPPGAGAMLVDGAEALERDALERLAALLKAHPFPCVIAARGSSPASRRLLEHQGRRMALHSTRELADSTEAKLPDSLLQCVRTVVLLPALGQTEMSQIAASMLGAKAVSPSPDLIRCVVSDALRSGGGGHELKALIDRLPPGGWRPVRHRSAGRNSKGRR